MSIDLLELLITLEEKWTQANSLAAGDELGIQQGTVDGLEIAIAHVRELQDIADPVKLREKLETLAADLTAEAAQMEEPLKKLGDESIDRLSKPIPNLFAMLSQLGPVMKGIRAGGRAMGLRSGADVIRWYLDDH